MKSYIGLYLYIFTGSVPANLWRQTDRPSYEAMVERHDSARWLRDDDNDVER